MKRGRTPLFGGLVLAGDYTYMPRLSRVVIPGAPHHITQRGNSRQPVFLSGRSRFLPQCGKHNDNYPADRGAGVPACHAGIRAGIGGQTSARMPAWQGVLGMSSSLEVEVFYPT